MVNIWLIYGLYVVYIYNIYMVCMWLIYGQYMIYMVFQKLGYTWEKSERIMENQWDIFSWTINMRL